jgi:hypothetical protein
MFKTLEIPLWWPLDIDIVYLLITPRVQLLCKCGLENLLYKLVKWPFFTLLHPQQLIVWCLIEYCYLYTCKLNLAFKQLAVVDLSKLNRTATDHTYRKLPLPLLPYKIKIKITYKQLLLTLATYRIKECSSFFFCWKILYINTNVASVCVSPRTFRVLTHTTEPVTVRKL